MKGEGARPQVELERDEHVGKTSTSMSAFSQSLILSSDLFVLFALLRRRK